MRIRARMLVFRTSMMLRQANRRRRRRLAAELSGYRTAAELNELHALLDAYPDGQTHEIREILAAQELRALLRKRAW